MQHTNYIGSDGHVFLDLTTKCYGMLTTISFSLVSASTFHFDLWKPSSLHDHVLYYTQKITADVGSNSVPVNETVFVEPGFILGVHADSDINIGIAIIDDAENAIMRYAEGHNETLWQPGLLYLSTLTEVDIINWRPSLGVQITPIFPHTGKFR